MVHAYSENLFMLFLRLAAFSKGALVLHSRPLLENEIGGFGFVAANGDLLGCRAQFFVPCLDRVGARRQVGQTETAIFAADREVGVFENGNVAAHPRMDVAAHRNRDFFARESFIDLRARRLSFVPFAIVGGDDVDIVAGGIVVDYLQWLVRAHSQDVRLVYAALLLDDRRLSGRIKSSVTQAIRDEDDYVLEFTVRIGYDFLICDWTGVLFGAARVRGHADRGGFGQFTFVLDFAFDGGGARCGVG